MSSNLPVTPPPKDRRNRKRNDATDAAIDLSRNRGQMLVIEGVRLTFLHVILLITLIFQSFQPGFINLDVLLPTYMLLALAFFLNFGFLFLIENALRYWVVTAFLFFFDSAFITTLIYCTGINQSIFLFLYLVNIILCGFVFKKRGAFILALWTSILFSFLVTLGPEMHGQTLYFSVALNNIAFFSVAFLSGLLSEQLNFMGSELQERGRDIAALRNLNLLIIENIASGLITVNRAGEILQSNGSALEILGHMGRQIVGHPLDAVLPGLAGQLAAIEFIEGDRRTSKRFDWSYVGQDGGKQVLEMIVSPLRDEQLRITGFVLAFSDLTRVRSLESAMRQSEKLAAVGQLAAGIAHEIRNPLASISGSIQLLAVMYESPGPEEKRLMAIVIKETDRLNNLISEFLDFVRPDQSKDDPDDVNALIRDTLELLKLNQNLRQETRQIVRLNSQSIISGNRDKLKQALLNIIINAYQAMLQTESPVIEVSTEDRDLAVVIRIKDHGTGIDEAGLKKIFEPFHTTKPKGTGLGLAVTHKIVESHNGRIFVESSKGHGTEFILEFPRRPSKEFLNHHDNLDLAQSSRSADDNSTMKRGHG